MLDPRQLRNDPEAVADALADRGYFFSVDEYIGLDDHRKILQQDTESLQAERNRRSKAIGTAKANGEDIEPLKREVSGLGAELEQARQQLAEIQEKRDLIHAALPNLPQADVPPGRDESDNLELRRWGDVPEFEFQVRDHVDIGVDLGGIDAEAAAKITGARFTVLRGPIARLHRALIAFMLDSHVDNGYLELNVPYIANAGSLFGTGQLPKFGNDLFRLTDPDDYYLIPTAEVPVTNLLADTIVGADELPLRYVTHTPCFRAEAGSAGRDVRGMIRQHQFEKVELVHIARPDESNAALETLTAQAESILQKLELPYRVMDLCAGDLGFSAARTYDIEVWLPSQSTYREISSCSNCEAFQARRMGARWRDPDTDKPQPVHTLNGSALAAGRTLVAILENGQQVDGSVTLPAALVPYMGGQRTLEPATS